MFKLVVCLGLIAAVLAAPEPAPKAKPGLIAAAYSAPIVAAAPALAYSSHYAAPALAYSSPYAAAPLAYSARYVAPSVYAGYSPYSSPLVVV